MSSLSDLQIYADCGATESILRKSYDATDEQIAQIKRSVPTNIATPAVPVPPQPKIVTLPPTAVRAASVIPIVTPTLATAPEPQHAAIEYLRMLFEPIDWVFFQLIHSTKTHLDKNGEPVADTKLYELMLLEKAATAETMEALEKEQADGWNVYICMNPFPMGTTHRREHLVQTIRNLYVETDELGGLGKIHKAVAEGLIPQPISVLQSSPGKYHAAWAVDGFSPANTKATLRALAKLCGGDPASTDLHRVLRMPGFKNLKYPDRPVCELVEVDPLLFFRNDASSFKLPVEGIKSKASGPALESEKLNSIAQLVEQNAEEARFEIGTRETYGSGYRWTFGCPWVEGHTKGTVIAAILLLEDGRLQFNCFHNYCADKGWSNIRQLWEKTVGKKQKFGDATGETGLLSGGQPISNSPMQSTIPSSEPFVIGVSVTPVHETLIDGRGEDTRIPPFNPLLMRGLPKAMTELAIQGTTITPQFAYEDAKTYLGLRISGRVRLQGNNFESRRDTVSIGETGSSKGESFKRLVNILQPEGAVGNICGVEIIYGYDSGPGLKDAFFQLKENGKDPRILCFVDEITEMGNQSAESRNPSVTDAFIGLFDSTHCSRVLAHRATKTMDNARFAAVLCAPSGEAVMSAFPGKNTQGLMDRMTPEFGVSQESGDLPFIEPEEAIKLMQELDRLEYGTIAMSAKSQARFEEFWRSQVTAVRRKNRFRLHLLKDILITAWGDGQREVTEPVLDSCFEIFTRGLIIREKSFGMEIPSRTGFYIGKIKEILATQERELKKGLGQERVALSQRDFATRTNAFRNNEEEFFDRAWKLCANYRASVRVTGKNKQSYEKWLPADYDE